MLEEVLFYLPYVGLGAVGLAVILAVVGIIRYFQYRPDGYFVRWLTDQQIRTLQNAGISYSTTQVNGEEGIRFARRDRRRVLNLLHAKAVASFALTRRLHELVIKEKPTLDPASEQFSVILDGDLELSRFDFVRKRLRKKRLLALVREMLLPVVSADVVIHFRAGRASKVTADKKFHVFVWSSPSGSATRRPTDTMWGVPVQDHSKAFAPSETGITLVDNNTTFTPAEIVENCLYIHHNALTTGSALELALLFRVLQVAKEELVVDSFLADIVKSLPEDGLPIGALASGPYAVTEHGFDGRRKAVVTSLLQEVLVPALQMNVFVKHCNGRTQKPPADEGQFNVLCQSSPIGKATAKTPEVLWGHRLLKRENAFMPSGRGIPILTDTGFAVAELLDNTLYVHQDLIHSGSRVGAALFARLLLEVRKQVAVSRGGEDVLRQQFQKECLKQVRQAQATTSNGANYSQCEQELQTTLRQARSMEQHLYRLEAEPADGLGREFDELCKIRKVLDVRMTDSYLIITTDLLYCVDSRTSLRHEIGAFEIQIPTGSSGTITWDNKTRRVRGLEGRIMNAPHVDGNGKACFGNTKDLFPMLIEKREFASAVELAIAFIESANTSDHWGKFVNNWPVAHG